MRVRIFKKKNDTIRNENEDNKVLISKKSLDRLILASLNEMLQEISLVEGEGSNSKVAAACGAKGFYRLEKILQIINAINLSEKGKLYAKPKK